MRRGTTVEYLEPLAERLHFDFWEPLERRAGSMAWLLAPVFWLLFALVYLAVAFVRRRV